MSSEVIFFLFFWCFMIVAYMETCTQGGQQRNVREIWGKLKFYSIFGLLLTMCHSRKDTPMRIYNYMESVFQVELFCFILLFHQFVPFQINTGGLLYTLLYYVDTWIQIAVVDWGTCLPESRCFRFPFRFLSSETHHTHMYTFSRIWLILRKTLRMLNIVSVTCFICRYIVSQMWLFRAQLGQRVYKETTVQAAAPCFSMKFMTNNLALRHCHGHNIKVWCIQDFKKNNNVKRNHGIMLIYENVLQNRNHFIILNVLHSMMW